MPRQSFYDLTFLAKNCSILAKIRPNFGDIEQAMSSQFEQILTQNNSNFADMEIVR
jgi:hypothetical protein